MDYNGIKYEFLNNHNNKDKNVHGYEVRGEKIYRGTKTTFDLLKDDISLLNTKTSVRESPKSLGICRDSSSLLIKF